MDEKKIMEGVRLLLEGIGEDPMREGLLETPQRIARMYQEIFAGLTQSPAQPLSKTFHTKQADLVLEKDIQFILASFPMNERLVFNRTYAGYRGGLTFTEDLYDNL